MNGRALAIAVFGAVLFGAQLVGCRPPGSAIEHPASQHGAASLPDVRIAKDRPPVVLIVREGDPSAAIAVAVTTSSLDDTDDDPEVAVALAGVVETRLAAKGLAPEVVPSWSGFRAAMLVATPSAAAMATDAARDALSRPIDEKDLAAAKKKLAALALRPLRDVSLARWARCVGSPHALPARAGKSGEDLTAATLERWRASAHGLGRVAIAVAAPPALAEVVAAAVARGPAWNRGAAPSTRAGASSDASASSGAAGEIDVAVYDASAEPSGALLVHATLDVRTGSDAVITAEALGDPHGPLATRLAALDLPFRLREVTGTANPRGGCLALVLEASPGLATASTSTANPGSPAAANELASRVADARALVHLEAQAQLAEGGTALDGRSLARRSGDARDAAERAAWWALADAWVATATVGPPRSNGPFTPMRGSIALGVPRSRGSTPNARAALEPSQDALASAVQRAAVSWQKRVAEGRARVEPGQGEAWVLVATPCGTDGESDSDSGLTALFTFATAEMAKSSPEARVEPWVVPDGAGLLVHGPALAGETSAAQARRLADVVARSFATDPVSLAALSRARAELLRQDTRNGRALGMLASAVSPGHASWFLASGRENTLARSADATVLARGQALRASPLRVAVLANVDTAQGDAALRAADRWLDRRVGDARTCRGGAAAEPARPGTYAVDPRPGAAPEAYLAFPFAARDEHARAAATIVAAALDGEGGLLDKAVGAADPTRASSARVVGWPRSPALVVRVVSTQAALDADVMQVRTLLDRVKHGGLAPADHERGTASAAREALVGALDPRARVVALWRGETIPSSAQPSPLGKATVEEVRAFAARYLAENTMIVVVSRPPRVRAP